MLKAVLSTPAGVFRVVCIFVALASLLAVAPWLYGYYQLLRVVVFFAGICCDVFMRSTGSENQHLAWALFAAALLFNPFLPIPLPFARIFKKGGICNVRDTYGRCPCHRDSFRTNATKPDK
ncbi:DUF6804 family protein [Mesorhizobium sp. M0491]|uniref:DUF6804 family protein n=1 Tax=Mesorhizobium sp. M0491 TaxID=2956950 RepID=UPI0033388D09